MVTQRNARSERLFHDPHCQFFSPYTGGSTLSTRTAAAAGTTTEAAAQKGLSRIMDVLELTLLRKSLYHPHCNFRWQGNHRSPASAASRSSVHYLQ
jgi:hypothetical protein